MTLTTMAEKKKRKKNERKKIMKNDWNIKKKNGILR